MGRQIQSSLFIFSCCAQQRGYDLSFPLSVLTWNLCAHLTIWSVWRRMNTDTIMTEFEYLPLWKSDCTWGGYIYVLTAKLDMKRERGG